MTASWEHRWMVKNVRADGERCVAEFSTPEAAFTAESPTVIIRTLAMWLVRYAEQRDDSGIKAVRAAMNALVTGLCVHDERMRVILAAAESLQALNAELASIIARQLPSVPSV